MKLDQSLIEEFEIKKYGDTLDCSDKYKKPKRSIILIICAIIVLCCILSFFFIKSNDKGVGYSWGPERKVYTNDSPAECAIFNSIIDNKAVGDERAFVRIREKTDEEEKYVGCPNKPFTVEPGKQYEIYIYYRNDANPSLNETGEGVAMGVKLNSTFDYQIEKGERGFVRASITAANTETSEVWNQIYLTAKEDVDIKYVANSAVIHNSNSTNGTILNENKLFSEEGVYLGVDELNGVVFAGAEYSGYITYTLSVESV